MLGKIILHFLFVRRFAWSVMNVDADRFSELLF